VSHADIEHRFTHHPPHVGRVNQHEIVRERVGSIAHFLDIRLPDGREKSLAITKLEEAMFWANAAIAREADK
jgi:hypothetical protein